jgi:hypothetical protein
MADLVKHLTTSFTERHTRPIEDTLAAVLQTLSGLVKLVSDMLPCLSPALRQELIEAADLPLALNTSCQQRARSPASQSSTGEASLAQRRLQALLPEFAVARYTDQ